MTINFREALATLSRALPAVLFRAGIFVAGGFMVIILFGMVLFAFRLAGSSGRAVAMGITVMAVLGWLGSILVLQWFFLYRHRAALLFLFSGCPTAAPGLPAAIQETRLFFPDHSRWAVLNRGLRRALSVFYRVDGESSLRSAADADMRFSRTLDLLASGPLSQAILALAFSRGNTDPGRSAREALALYFRHGLESRRLARQWLWFSAAGLALLFLCLALPNWFFFRSAGAPVGIGIILAAAIAWLLHQAFVIPFVLAGMSGALLAETRGKTPDPDLCIKIDSLVPALALLNEKTN